MRVEEVGLIDQVGGVVDRAHPFKDRVQTAFLSTPQRIEARSIDLITTVLLPNSSSRDLVRLNRILDSISTLGELEVALGERFGLDFVDGIKGRVRERYGNFDGVDLTNGDEFAVRETLMNWVGPLPCEPVQASAVPAGLAKLTEIVVNHPSKGPGRYSGMTRQEKRARRRVR